MKPRTLSHNVIFVVSSTWAGFEFTTLVVIGTDSIGSWTVALYGPFGFF
jgi:hypothetical protein